MGLFNLDVIKDEKVVVNGVEHKIEDVKMKEYIELQRKIKAGEFTDDFEFGKYLCELMLPTLDFNDLSLEQYRMLNEKLLSILSGGDESEKKKTIQGRQLK